MVVADSAPLADRAAVLTGAARNAGNDPLTIGLLIDSNANAIELWLVDRLTGKLLLRRIEGLAGATEQKPEVLARHTVDVLRGTLLDLLVTGLRTAVSEVHSERRRELPTVEKEPIPRAGMEGGVVLLGSFGGVDPALVPLLRVRFSASETFELRATGAAFGTRAGVRAAAGTASIDQSFGLVECVAWLMKNQSRVRPLVSVGAGAYSAVVEGSAAPPYLGLHASQVAFALDGGLGAAIPLARHLELIVEGHALVTAPGIAIRLLTVDAADVGRPSVLGTLTLGGWI